MSESDEISGFVPPPIEDLNQWLSGYEFIDLLACGGMGAVYRARQISLDRMVAIKILPPELSVNETFRKSFEAEGKAMAKLSHSNLVGVYDFGAVSDMLYLVIEFVEGSDLYASKGDSAIDPETAVTLIRSVSAGLAEAHKIGLVHRDIKPANILINTDLVPKLGDFGLAVPDSDIESGLMMGTPAYLAPEVLADPTSASFASDTYALGVILYEMLTGSSIEQGDVIDHAKVPKLGELPKIIRKALDPQPLTRYQSGDCLEAALKDWLDKPKGVGLATTAAGPVIRTKVNSSASESSGGGGGLLLGLLGLALIGGVAWFVFGTGGDLEDEIVDEDSSTSAKEEVVDAPAKGEMDEGPSLEDLRSEQKKALDELRVKITEERRQNRSAFIEASGSEGERFLEEIATDSNGLPRHFLSGEIGVSKILATHLEEFAGYRQTAMDRKFSSEISKLHRESLKNLRAADEDVPPEVRNSWERWTEWLGLNPMTVSQTSMAGLWRLSSSAEGFDLHLSASGKKVLMIGEERIENKDLIQVSETGEIVLKHSGDPSLRFPWKLRWSGDRLEGEDATGGPRILRLLNFNFESLVKAQSDLPAEMVEGDSTGDEVKEELFQDAEVAALTRNYHKALLTKIEPLETGYLRVLDTMKEAYREKIDATAMEQINGELDRVKAIKWRDGFVQMEMIPESGEVPKDVAEKEEVFRKEFKRRYEPIQRTYRNSLQTMLRKRKGRGDTNLADLEKALKKLETPEGAVRARYVKIVSLPDQGNEHATIALFEIYDAEGKALPRQKFAKAKTSSYETQDFGRSCPGSSALDGNPNTYWHTKWRQPAGTFPHWLSFDLGSEQWITGFQITSREWHKERLTDVTKWQFFVSLDDEKWVQVAAGDFSIGVQSNKHIGFEEVD